MVQMYISLILKSHLAVKLKREKKVIRFGFFLARVKKKKQVDRLRSVKKLGNSKQFLTTYFNIIAYQMTMELTTFQELIFFLSSFSYNAAAKA